MKGKTNCKQAGSPFGGEYVNIRLITNLSDHTPINGAVITVSYETYTEDFIWDGNELTLMIPAYVKYTISFGNVDGYKSPDNVSYTSVTDNARTIEVVYYTELITINISSDSGQLPEYSANVSVYLNVTIDSLTVLEYIESTGTQYIDTGFIPNKDTRVEILTGITSAANASNGDGYIPYGAGINYNDSAYECYSVNGTFNINYSNQVYKIGTVTSGHKVKVSHNKELISITDETDNKTWAYTFNYNDYSVPNTMTICAINRTSGVVCGKMKLYSCKIYDNNILIRDYTPVLRSDGIAGLYDTVNDTFTSSSGSDNFIAGSTKLAIIATQTSATETHKIPFGITYQISTIDIDGYVKPNELVYTAETKHREVALLYKQLPTIDLSLLDIYGNSIKRATANCYVVKEPGIYKFPLVYGNAIIKNRFNKAAYTSLDNTYHHKFVDGIGNEITSPYIQYNVSSTETLRSICSTHDDTVPAILLPTNSIITDKDTGIMYIKFNIEEIPATGCNYVFSVMSDKGCIWSWHVWAWPYDLTPIEITSSLSVKYNILPVNLASKYDEDMIHMKNWFYQWGRPTPMLLPSAWNSNTDYSDNIMLESKAGTIAEGLTAYVSFFYNATAPYNWFGDASYYNLWDAGCTKTEKGWYSRKTIKTIYDPCPIGWKVPDTFVFAGLTYIKSENGYTYFTKYSSDTEGVAFPLSGRRGNTNGTIDAAGGASDLWTTNSESQNNAYRFTFNQNICLNELTFARANGCSIRPVEDSTPTATGRCYFTIGQTVSCESEYPMTWFEWMNSEYNNVNAEYKGGRVVCNINGTEYGLVNSDEMRTIILNGVDYGLSV